MEKHKWVILFGSLLLLVLAAQLVVGPLSSIALVKLMPTTLYIDGTDVAESERAGYFLHEDKYLPTALQYRGTLYVPLVLIGKHTQQPVGWNEATRTAWLGKPSPARKTSGSPQSSPTQNAPNDGDRSPSADTGKNSSSEKPVTASEQNKTAPAQSAAQPERPSLFGLTLGDRAERVTALLGEPARREPSALGYEWWIYNQDLNRYIQVGVAAGKVVDIYSNAPQARIGPITIGTSREVLSRRYPLQQVMSFSYAGANVEISNLPNERPLVMVNDSGLIFYLDQHDGHRVTAMRIIGQLQLVQGGYYETKWTFRGQSPNFDPPPLSVKAQEAVNAAHERQILDLVNVIRHRNNLPRLRWNEQAAHVARQHSREMKEKQFFDHVSVTTGWDPFERLRRAGLAYHQAGENIAAGFADAIEAHESWMNSLDHRKNVLEKAFTDLGVGVVGEYYTQNFLTLAEGS